MAKTRARLCLQASDSKRAMNGSAYGGAFNSRSALARLERMQRATAAMSAGTVDLGKLLKARPTTEITSLARLLKGRLK